LVSKERAKLIVGLMCKREYHVGDPEVLHRELTEVCGQLWGAVATEPFDRSIVRE